nr:MFS transporter [Spelaeicoccus albus]
MCIFMRLPVVGVAPIIDVIQRDLGFSSAAAGLLTSIPVLCFAAFTPVASAILARAGINAGVIMCLIAIIVGSGIRSVSATSAVLIGTVILGCALAIANVAVPTLVARDYRHRASMMTGLQTAGTNLGSMAVSALIAPTAALLGWQLGLFSWSAAAIFALALWLIALTKPFRRSALSRVEPSTATSSVPRIDESGRGRLQRLFRSPLAVTLAVAFACHNFAYYAVTAWLPVLLIDAQGRSASTAGWYSSLFQALGVAGTFAVPVLTGWRRWPASRLLIVVASCWVLLPLGLLTVPALSVVWIIAGGVAQGGTFTLITVVIITRSVTMSESRRLTAFVQTIGYGTASVGPVLLGGIHDAAGNWVVPFLVVLAATIGVGAAGLYATKTRAEAR